jgi:hypothetical protein
LEKLNKFKRKEKNPYDGYNRSRNIQQNVMVLLAQRIMRGELKFEWEWDVPKGGHRQEYKKLLDQRKSGGKMPISRPWTGFSHESHSQTSKGAHKYDQTKHNSIDPNDNGREMARDELTYKERKAEMGTGDKGVNRPVLPIAPAMMRAPTIPFAAWTGLVKTWSRFIAMIA